MLSANDRCFDNPEFSTDDLAYIDELIMRVTYLAQFVPSANDTDKQFAELNLVYLSGLKKYREYMLQKMEQK